MTAWNRINPNQLIPSQVVSSITTLADLIASVLAPPAALSVPSLPSIPSPADAARTVVNALLDTLTAFLKGGRIHTLVIPIAKTVPAQPPPSLPPTLDDLQAALQVTLGPSNTAAADAYASMLTKNGGNAGFYNAFAQSLFDLQDPNRPQYDAQTDAVAMSVLLVGAPSYAAITAAAATIDLLVKPKAGSSTAARTAPVPQNLVGRVVGASVPPGVGVRLDWDAPPASATPPFFPGLRFTVKRYAIVRSTNAKTQNASTVLDLFPTSALTEGLVSGDAKVVTIGSGRNSAFLDADASLDPNKPLYYCIAWELSVTENGTSTMLPFGHVSNVVKVMPKAPAPAQTGASPDWTATQSAIDVFPDLSHAAQRLLAEARVLTKPSASPLDAISSAIALADSASKRIASRSTELIDDVKRLSTALSTTIPSLYVTSMTSTNGGNAFLLAELSKRLGDRSDPTRPPFDNGEYVCGVCLVAGAPRLADLAATVAFFGALFGPASASNPLLGILAAIDTLVTRAETVVFGPDMVPLPPTTVVDPTTGLPPAPPTPVTANDGTAVATSSPQNPNAGDTNVVLPSELC